MAPIAAILALVKREELVQLCSEFGIELAAAAPIAIGVISLCLMMNYMSGVALSLEGDSLWVIKSMPIRARDLLLSKTVPHILVSLPFCVISSTLLAIALRLDFLSVVLVLLIPIAATVFSALVGVVYNVLFPKFKYNNEAEPIKQSASVLFTILTMMLVAVLSIGFAVIGVIFSIELVMHVLILVLLLALSGSAYLLLRTVCERRYESF